MPDEPPTVVPPAMTAREWAALGTTMLDGTYVAVDPGLGTLEVGRDVLITQAEDLAGVLALANAALPDDDPRKVTRADVDALETVVGWAEDTGADDTTRAARALAAKLAALLPPEGGA